jgi:hypothetical protein
MENPTINKRRSKVCNTCIDKPIYALRGLLMKMGNVIILKYYIIFFVKVIVRVFHDKDNEGIVHLVYSKCNPFVMDGGVVCNMA